MSKNNYFAIDGAVDTQCEDKNECLLVNDCSANASCENTEESYTCTCDNGYIGNGNDEYHDDNESKLSIHYYEANTRCSNIDGSFYI